MTEMTELVERAAAKRKAAVRSINDRPSERRASETPGSLWASRSVTRHPVEVRSDEGSKGLSFSGYASVTEAPYEMYDFFGPYTEIVARGAFEATLQQADLDVPLVLNHDSLRRIARTTNGSLQLAEDDIGLRADASDLDETDHDVAYIAPKLRSGLIDEMSFRFSITSGQWSPDYTEFRINSVDIQRGDVAIVGYGASPHTTAQLRSLASKIKVGRALDAEDVNMLTQAMAWMTSIDLIVDQAQETLAGYLKVPNPDTDEDDSMSNLSSDDLNKVLRGARTEMQRRSLKPPMTLQELLRD